MNNSSTIAHDKALEYILAGNSTFTLRSKTTGARFTYKAIYKKYFGEDIVVVKLLNGTDNVNDYGYLCTIKIIDGVPKIIRDKSRISATAKSFVIFDMVFFKLLVGLEMNNLEIWHEGVCCRCGRKLTVPESIQSGIGPECATKTSMFKIW